MLQQGKYDIESRIYICLQVEHDSKSEIWPDRMYEEKSHG